MGTRALVLGGGGIAGIAWEWGLLAGLAEAGVDLSGADLLVGTSAGSVVGTQLAAGADPVERWGAQLEPPDGELGARMGMSVLLKWGAAIGKGGTPEQVRARIGQMAVRAATVSEAERVKVIEGRLPVREWPERPLLLTAVDVETGEFRVFDKGSGVPLVKAVAASCAVPGVWPPVEVDGRRYMDGGVRSGVNADLAAGCDRILVVAPNPRGTGPILGAVEQTADLPTDQKLLVVPDVRSKTAMGRNPLDPACREPSARAGREQAAAVAEAVSAIWR